MAGEGNKRPMYQKGRNRCPYWKMAWSSIWKLLKNPQNKTPGTNR